jgi:hypothetical protein
MADTAPGPREPKRYREGEPPFTAVLVAIRRQFGLSQRRTADKRLAYRLAISRVQGASPFIRRPESPPEHSDGALAVAVDDPCADPCPYRSASRAGGVRQILVDVSPGLYLDRTGW